MGTHGYTHGDHYWEVKLLEPCCGNSIMIGVCTEDADLKSTNFINLIGELRKTFNKHDILNTCVKCIILLFHFIVP